ncbi:alpha/beta hydrolase [Halolamina litorea]|uniref:Alpha/beta hydrolase n=1 Tax=Halolamina litorea TaxID=1515593 RepID=A0ABD6BXR2_9EURY|nr:alpha/beta hydrolase [Halolamina litorea]
MNRWRQAIAVLFVVLLVGSGGVSLYFSMPYHGSESSVQQIRDDPQVTVTTEAGVHVISPAEADPTVGVVFYPGARVAPDAYYSTFAPVAKRANVTVFVPKMPLNLALLGTDAAERVRSQHPGIRTWFVGGHSLGGVAACQYASSHDVRGLVLFASYCNVDIRDEPFAVLSVTGSADTVLNRERYQEANTRLPPDTTSQEITGMNHTQFGSYRGQRGDSPAPLSYDEAHQRLADVLGPWLTNQSTPAVSVGGNW